MSRSSNTNSSACRIRPASATTRNPARSFRSNSTARRQLHARHVPERWAADLRRPRAVGLSQEIRPALARRRQGYAVGTLDYGGVRIATGTMGFKHKALDPNAVPRRLGEAELSSEDHPARRRHAAHPRTRRLPARRHRHERRLGGPATLDLQPACAGADCRSASARDHLRNAHRCRSHPRAGQGRLRLSRDHKESVA